MSNPLPESAAAGPDLIGYELLACVCGGIAAYKICTVVSELVQRGAGVTVAMTQAAAHFVQPLTFQALSGRPVLLSLWDAPDGADIQHIQRTEATDLVLVAPATANILGKVAGGIADEIVSTLVMCADSPVVFAPAMNNRMWENPAVQRSVAVLSERRYPIIGPGRGWLACRSVGPGRMVEAREILDFVSPLLKSAPPKSSRFA